MFFALNCCCIFKKLREKLFFNTYPIIYISGALHLFLKNLSCFFFLVSFSFICIALFSISYTLSPVYRSSLCFPLSENVCFCFHLFKDTSAGLTLFFLKRCCFPVFCLWFLMRVLWLFTLLLP